MREFDRVEFDGAEILPYVTMSQTVGLPMTALAILFPGPFFFWITLLWWRRVDIESLIQLRRSRLRYCFMPLFPAVILVGMLLAKSSATDIADVLAAVSIVECAAYGGFMRAAWERMKK